MKPRKLWREPETIFHEPPRPVYFHFAMEYQAGHLHEGCTFHTFRHLVDRSKWIKRAKPGTRREALASTHRRILTWKREHTAAGIDWRVVALKVEVKNEH